MTGHQVYGGSEPEMYSSALLLGCRLVELDVYNGGPLGPVVKHGFTMTGDILLRDALSNIRKSAFVYSEFPVVLSIENHCNEENQLKMASMFSEILVDLFVIESDTNLIKYPSPNRLKRKFIIKVIFFFNLFFTKIMRIVSVLFNFYFAERENIWLAV